MTASTAIERHEPEGGILSNVVQANGLIFTAGMVGDDLTLDVAGQMREALAYLDKCLALCGSDKSRILFATIWLKDIRDREAMNEAWLAWVDPAHLPARACVQAAMADKQYLVELAVVATR